MDQAETEPAGFLIDVFGATAAEETPVVVHRSPWGRDAKRGRHRTASQRRRRHRRPAVATAATVGVAVVTLAVFRPGAEPNPAVGPSQTPSRPTLVDSARTVPFHGDHSSGSSAAFQLPPPPAAEPPPAAIDTTGPEPTATTRSDIDAAPVPARPLATESSMAGKGRTQPHENKVEHNQGGRGHEGSPLKTGKDKTDHRNKGNRNQ
jgi:hypothetical protein